MAEPHGLHAKVRQTSWRHLTRCGISGANSWEKRSKKRKENVTNKSFFNTNILDILPPLSPADLKFSPYFMPLLNMNITGWIKITVLFTSNVKGGDKREVRKKSGHMFSFLLQFEENCGNTQSKNREFSVIIFLLSTTFSDNFLV
jgi:hypothetical protein